MPDYGNASHYRLPSQAQFNGFQMNPLERALRSAQEAVMEGPTRQLMDWATIQETRYAPTPSVKPSTSVDDLRKRYAGTSMANVNWAKFTNRDGSVNDDTVNYLENRMHERAALQMMTQNNYSNLVNGTASFAGAVAGSLLDPINLATAFIPMTTARTVAGATLAKVAPRAGNGMLAHALVGGAENGLIAGTMIEPFMGALHSRLDDPYTMRDYWNNIGMASLIGAGFGAVGGVFDISGRGLVEEYKAKVDADFARNNPTKYKQDAFSDLEKKLANADADTIDFALKAMTDAELKGNTAFSPAKIVDMSTDFQRSTITPAARDLARLAVAIEEGGTDNATRIRLGEAKKRGKGENIHWVAKREIEGKIFEGTGSTKKQAEIDLNNKVYKEIKKYQPTITQQGDVYIARYNQDAGRGRELTGAGRTKSEAIHNLNERYRDVDRSLTDINRLREEIRSGEISNYTTHMENNIAARARQIHEDFAQGLIGERELKRELNKLDQEMKDFQTDYTIWRENTGNFEKEIYNKQIPGSPEQMLKEGIEALNHKTPGSVERDNQIQLETDTAKVDTRDAKSLAVRNQRHEDIIFNSELYENLAPEIKDNISANYAVAKADADILNSGEVKNIFDKYISCRRGM